MNTGTPNSPTKWGIDLQSEHERYLTEKYAKEPVIVMNHPKGIKAFYMRVNDDGANAETDHRHRHAWRQRDRV